jgi:hypothetical protein
MTIFKYTKKTIVNKERYYPANDFARLFLALNQARDAKTFTKEHLDIITEISKHLNFTIKETKEIE